MKTLETGKRIALKNILFATDFSPCSNAALPYAVAIANHFSAKLYGAHVLATGQYLFMAPETWPSFLEEEELLQQAAKEKLDAQLRGVPHRVLSGVGDVWDVINQLIKDHEIDLIVVGTHGRTGARKLLMGSIAEKIFRQAVCPVLSVGPNVSCRPDREIRFQQILFATDLGEDSLAALPYAIALAEEDQARLILLHVVGEPTAGFLNAEKVKASLVRRLRELIPPEAEPWCDAECLVEFGRQFAFPADRILEITRDRASDLIVLGVHPTPRTVGAVTHLAHTTAQQIVAHATCPVLTVRG